MTREFLNTLTRHYHAYVDTFRDADCTLPDMMRLKLEHTLCVVEDAKRIMDGEGWPEHARIMGEACALLHDAGRYSQLKEFGTFQDAKSIDHAKRGVQVITGQGWLKDTSDEDWKTVLTAVSLHNKKKLSPTLSPSAAAIAHLVRDADKLDIFRLMESAVSDGSLERNPEIAWELPVKGPPSPDIVACVSKGQSVSYAHVKSFSDFVLIQVGWLVGGLHYPTSLRLARQRNVLEFREAFLKTLSDDPGIDLCCRAARAYMKERLP